MLTIKSTADQLDITEARTYVLIRSGILPAVRFGRSLRVEEGALHRWIAAGGRGNRPPVDTRTL